VPAAGSRLSVGCLSAWRWRLSGSRWMHAFTAARWHRAACSPYPQNVRTCSTASRAGSHALTPELQSEVKQCSCNVPPHLVRAVCAASLGPCLHRAAGRSAFRRRTARARRALRAGAAHFHTRDERGPQACHCSACELVTHRPCGVRSTCMSMHTIVHTSSASLRRCYQVRDLR